MDTLNDADAGVVIENMEENYYILGRIWGFHSSEYEECRLLGCGAV
jgi:hypothetical protein